MSKRLFQVLDEMNVNDGTNKTETCACCFDMVGANKVKAGGHVTMGVPDEALMKIFIGDYQPMLVLLNKKVYHKLKEQPVEDRLKEAEQRAERYEKALREIVLLRRPLNDDTAVLIALQSLNPKPTPNDAE